MTAGATVVPALRYRDAATAIEFLCGVFGFERHLVVPGPEGMIAHAELTIGGSGMVMLGSAGQSTYDQYVSAPKEAGAATMTCYVVAADPDVHYDRARKGGAEILREDRGPGIRRPRLHLSRSGGKRLDLRLVRSVGQPRAAVTLAPAGVRA